MHYYIHDIFYYDMHIISYIIYSYEPYRKIIFTHDVYNIRQRRNSELPAGNTHHIIIRNTYVYIIIYIYNFFSRVMLDSDLLVLIEY